MTTYVALLRGVNVGGARRLSMPDLRAELTYAGYDAVRTYVQSGNIVLAGDVPAARLEEELRALIERRLGVDTPVLVRTRDQLAEVVARNPLADVADDPRRLQVTFLSDEPAPEVVRDLLTADVAPEQAAVAGREIYAWHPDGIQRSPLARLLTDQRLGVTASARSWRTVTALLALADE